MKRCSAISCWSFFQLYATVLLSDSLDSLVTGMADMGIESADMLLLLDPMCCRMSFGSWKSCAVFFESILKTELLLWEGAPEEDEDCKSTSTKSEVFIFEANGVAYEERELSSFLGNKLCKLSSFSSILIVRFFDIFSL